MKVRDKNTGTAVPILGCGKHSCPSVTQSGLRTDGVGEEGQPEEAHLRSLPQSQLGFAKLLWAELAASFLVWQPIAASPCHPIPLYQTVYTPPNMPGPH